MPNYYHTANDLFPLKKYKFNDFYLKGPKNPIPYLDRAYGPDWRHKAYKSYDHEHERGINIISFDINKEHFKSETNTKPKLWVYWEDKPETKMPAYIKLCLKSMEKHCKNSFDVIKLDEKSIYDYLPELHHTKYNLSNLLIAQKVDYYRVLLLAKYGGLYLDADVLVLKDPIEIIDKLKEYDYVGFGCTGEICNYGYGKPSNAIMASRKNGKLIQKVKLNIETKLKNNKVFDYFDLGKLVIWEELDKLIEKENYKYYHYSNDFDGTRDINGQWVNTPILFSSEELIYKTPSEMLFVVMYNSGMDDIKKLSENDLLKSNLNISKFFKQSLFGVSDSIYAI